MKTQAEKKHAELKAEALDLIASLTAKLERDIDRIDWGHCGDLEHLVTRLQEIQ